MDFVVEIEGENGDGKDCIVADGAKTSEGINGISEKDPSCSSSGNILGFDLFRLFLFVGTTT